MGSLRYSGRLFLNAIKLPCSKKPCLALFFLLAEWAGRLSNLRGFKGSSPSDSYILTASEGISRSARGKGTRVYDVYRSVHFREN